MISMQMLIPWLGIALSTICFLIVLAIAPEESDLNHPGLNPDGKGSLQIRSEGGNSHVA